MHRNYFDVGAAHADPSPITSSPAWLPARFCIPKIYNGRDKTFFLFGYHPPPRRMEAKAFCATSPAPRCSPATSASAASARPFTIL